MFTGTGTALVTPFLHDGSLDEPTLRALIKRQIDAGIDFLVPCGTTGESPTLTHEEHLRVVEIAVELAKGRCPSSPAQADTIPLKSLHSLANLPKSARTEFFPSRRITTSRHKKASTSITKRLRLLRRCQLLSIACKDARA